MESSLVESSQQGIRKVEFTENNVFAHFHVCGTRLRERHGLDCPSLVLDFFGDGNGAHRENRK